MQAKKWIDAVCKSTVTVYREGHHIFSGVMCDDHADRVEEPGRCSAGCVETNDIFLALAAVHPECVRKLTTRDPAIAGRPRWEEETPFSYLVARTPLSNLVACTRPGVPADDAEIRCLAILLDVPGIDAYDHDDRGIPPLESAIRRRIPDFVTALAARSSIAVILQLYWRERPFRHVPVGLLATGKMSSEYGFRTPELMRELHRRRRWGDMRKRGIPDVWIRTSDRSFVLRESPCDMRAVYESLDAYERYCASAPTRHSVIRAMVVVSQRGLGKAQLRETSTSLRTLKASRTSLR